jgi:hypothetical protein
MKRALIALLFLLLPREAHAHNSCVEQSDVVGDRTCGRYGDQWSTERTFPLVIATGMWSGHVVPSLHRWGASIGKDNPARVGIDGRELGITSVNDVGMDFRFHGYAAKHFYVGMDWAIALGKVNTKLTQNEGFEFRDKSSVNYAHVRFAAVLGGRVPLGPLSARLEALVGLQIVSISMEARKNGSDWVSASVTSAGLILEPRLAVDVWTTPWSTLTAWGGMSVIYPADRTMGLSIALHGRAFDGRF